MNVIGSDAKILGYMDGTDFVEGLGQQWNGVPIYPSPRSVLANATCSKNCGVVEISIQFSQVMSSGTAEYFSDIDIKDVEAKNEKYWAWQQANLEGWKAHREMLKARIKDFDKRISDKERELAHV
jgi:hypothetical protein